MITPDIFYVEDDPDFAFFMKQAVLKVDKTPTIRIVTNGREAMDILTIMTEGNNKPQLILLDFSLPGLSGLELVKLIRGIPFFNTVPVLMFSTANNTKDIKMCLEAGANEYVIKVAGYSKLVSSVKEICERWLGVDAAIK